uniref:Tectonin beta-propeller repeat-containing protein 2-like n=1 Tax=Phallusia mammillata TaxID=59560 RepID=A0A6F9DTV9_9ASCI|nr:tectonin beta-propeller repeat-containing protein 2-like [Phallusia mammillata]
MSENTFVQEYPLAHDVFKNIPEKFYHGLKSSQLEVTSFDATESHIVFGTNAGCAFLHNREAGSVIKIVTNSNYDIVTSAKILVGLDYQIALGTSEGRVVIIIFSTTTTGTTKQVKKFSLGKLHSSEVCSLAWSLNGMKLFSGDANGEIFCSSVNFDLNTCNATKAYSEGSRIVQMQYKHKSLLVATTEKVIVHSSDKSYDIGKKPTRSGEYGACFNENTLSEVDLKIYSARPSLRVWLAGIDGTVLSTLKLKEMILNSGHVIKLSNADTIDTENVGCLEFGRVLLYQDVYLVSYHENSLYIIDLRSNTVSGVMHNLSGLMDVAVTKNEILILCKKRILHRLSDLPDSKGGSYIRQEKDTTSNFKGVKNSFFGFKKNFTPLVGALQSKMSNISVSTESLTSKAKELKQKVSSMAVVEIAENFMFSNPKQESDIELKQSPLSPNKEESDNIAHMNSGDKTETDGDMEQNNFHEYLVVRELLKEMLNCIDELECQDSLHSQGEIKLPQLAPSPETEQKIRRFDEISLIAAEENPQEIVFRPKSKPKRKKSKDTNKTSSSSSSSSSLSTSDLHSHQRSCESLDEFFLHHDDEARQRHEEQVAELLGAKELPVETCEPSHKDHTTKPSEDQSHSKHSPETISIPLNDITHTLETSGSKEIVPCGSKDSPTITHDHLSEVQQTANEDAEDDLHSNIPQRCHNDTFPDVFQEDEQSPLPSPNPFKTPISLHASGNDIFETNPNKASDNDISETSHNKASENGNFETSDEAQTKLETPCFDKQTASDMSHKKEASLSLDLQERQAFTQNAHEEPETPDIYDIDPANCDFESENETDEEGDSDGAETQIIQPTDDAEINTRDSEYFALAKQHAKYLTSVVVPHKVADVWEVLNPPGYTVSSISASGNFICHTTFRNRVYVVEESSMDRDVHNIMWRKLSKRAFRISVSPSGDFAWIVTQSGNVYATQWPIKIPPASKCEVALNWKLVSSGASDVTVGVSEAWLVDSYGKITRQVGLSRSQCCMQGGATVPVRVVREGRIVKDVKVSQVVLTTDVAWVLLHDGTTFCKPLADVDSISPWTKVNPPVSTDGVGHTLKLIASDSQSTVWTVNDVGEVWFRSSLSAGNPCGKQWWQMYLNEYLQKPKDSVAQQTMRMMSEWVYGTSNARCVGVSMGAVWFASVNNKIHVAKGPVTGNAWEVPKITGISPSTRWSHITSSSIFSPDGGWEGVVWLARGNGEVIRFISQHSTHPQRAISLEPPTVTSSEVTCFSASREALWMILSSGEIYVRSGVSGSNPIGIAWNRLDVSAQLGDRKMVHVSCGSQSVWALDDIGNAYVRLGASHSESHVIMTPAWLKIDSPKFNGAELKLEQIACGPSDLNVWALDNYGNIYARIGVTVDMLVGEGWKLVEGCTAKQLSISNHSVWALRHDGSLLRRYGMTRNDSVGDYWKKAPGHFERFTATPYDELLALDTHHQLRAHVTHLYRPPMVEAMCDDFELENDETVSSGRQSRDSSPDDPSWELV